MAERDKDDDLEGKKGVCLITLHAAKGLEFPHVYLVGLEEGILPHKRSLEEGTRDEERRLLYVGITRAKETLSLSYCYTRKRYGDALPCYPSSSSRSSTATTLRKPPTKIGSTSPRPKRKPRALSPR